MDWVGASFFLNFVVEPVEVVGERPESVGSLWATWMLSIGCPHGPKGPGRSAGLVHKSTGRAWIMRQVPNFVAVLRWADGK